MSAEAILVIIPGLPLTGLTDILSTLIIQEAVFALLIIYRCAEALDTVIYFS